MSWDCVQFRMFAGKDATLSVGIVSVSQLVLLFCTDQLTTETFYNADYVLGIKLPREAAIYFTTTAVLLI